MSTSDACAPHFVEWVAGARGERAPASVFFGEAGEAPALRWGALPEEGKGRGGRRSPCCRRRRARRETATELRACTWATATVRFRSVAAGDGDDAVCCGRRCGLVSACACVCVGVAAVGKKMA
jgi:hypothetical protein